MRPFTNSIITASLIGLFAAGQTFAADQQEYVQSGSAVQAETQQQSSVIPQQQISAEQLTSEQVRKLQQSLQENGIDPGPLDGIMGERTENALREFQQVKGLAATGQLNSQTLEALHLKFKEFMGVAPEIESDVMEQQAALQGERN